MRPLVLDLLRHGEALPAGPAGPAGDQGRPLSPAGRRTLERLGAHLAGDGDQHDRVLVSPLRRAAESATALLDAFPVHATIETLDELAPDSSPTRLLEALRRLALDGGHALVVGHQPLLGQFALLLTGAEAGFAPGTLVRLECPRGLAPGAGRLARVIHPRDLRGGS